MYFLSEENVKMCKQVLLTKREFQRFNVPHRWLKTTCVTTGPSDYF